MERADGGRISSYGALWVFALAFGWIEANVVVHLRDLYLRDASAAGGDVGLQVTQVALPYRVMWIEIIREACTMFVLAAVGWLSSRRLAGRIGGFLIAFGIWDLMYYAVLWLVIAWPDSLAAWDILFLIPVAWVAPVWAPVVVAVLFVATGSWLFLTDTNPRDWRWGDAAVIVAACAIIVGSFVVESRAATERRVPERFAWWLYWPGVALGTEWFVRAERREKRR